MSGHPIPQEFPLRELVGQEVTQVSIAITQLQVHLCEQPQAGTPDKWKPGARIDTEAAITVKQGKTSPVRIEPSEFKLAASLVAGLLGETVIEAHKQSANEVCLVFASGNSLCLHTDPQGLDSFHIHVGGESITVTRV